MIRARFQTGDHRVFERDMPYPPREGDYVEADDTGENWEVKSVIWVLPPLSAEQPVSLIVRLA